MQTSSPPVLSPQLTDITTPPQPSGNNHVITNTTPSNNPMKELPLPQSRANKRQEELPVEQSGEHHHKGRCERCEEVIRENAELWRRVARLRQRLRDAVETAQTHGQRLLRAAFQEKIRELNKDHNMQVTDMLNRQKKCFEEELEAMDLESQTASITMQRELEGERAMRVEIEARYDRERELALEKTTLTMSAVRRKMDTLHATVNRLQREKKTLNGIVSEKQVMIEVLASAAAAKDVERRRLDVLGKVREEERIRKDCIVERLETELAAMTEKLGQERRVNLNLLAKIDEMEQGRTSGDGDSLHANVDSADGASGGNDPGARAVEKDGEEGCREEVERLGRLFNSVMSEFGNVQADVSTND